MRVLGALLCLGLASGFALPSSPVSSTPHAAWVRKTRLPEVPVATELRVRGGGLTATAAATPTTALTTTTALRAGATAATPAPTGGLKHTLKIGAYFFLWYLFNIGYNIYNKKALNALPLPFLVGAVQLSLGLLYVIPLWILGLRKAPKVSKENIKNLTPVALMHMLAHITAVVALGAGAVSFTHIVKAAEPAFTSLLSALLLKQFFALPVYLSLVPVMGGVAVASLTERSFSWLAFCAAMAANTASALRGIFAKQTMKKPQGENMDAVNLYAVLTIIASFFLTPLAFALEGAGFQAAWQTAVAKVGQANLLKYILGSGLYFYLYNEVAFLALDNVHPVTHAVGNTIKRVVIIAASILVFKNPVTTQGYIGSGIAIAGVLLYSLAVEKTKKR